MGLIGFDGIEMVTIHADKVRMSINTYKTTNDEMSTMTFDGLMAFVGADYAVAA